jgi:hypothetical protein
MSDHDLWLEEKMKHFACAMLGFVASTLVSAATAVAGLNGDYTLIFYSGPSHQKSASYCITFTNTGTIDSFPDSGTWEQSGDSGWGGNFVVDGNVLRWYGTYSNGTGATNFYNKIKNDIPGKGGFDEWNVSAPPITAVVDGITRLKAGCRPH